MSCIFLYEFDPCGIETIVIGKLIIRKPEDADRAFLLCIERGWIARMLKF